MSDAKTLGTIGQKYENRKSGKSGTLTNNSNGCMDFVDDTGFNFQVSYGSFKSNWRKVQTDDATTTESVAESAEKTTDTTVKDVVEKAKKKAEKKETAVDDRPFKSFSELLSFVTAHTAEGTSITSNEETSRITIRIGRISVYQIWVDENKAHKYSIYMNESQYELVKDFVSDCEYVYSDKFGTNNHCKILFDMDMFESVIETLVSKISVPVKTLETNENTESEEE